MADWVFTGSSAKVSITFDREIKWLLFGGNVLKEWMIIIFLILNLKIFDYLSFSPYLLNSFKLAPTVAKFQPPLLEGLAYFIIVYSTIDSFNEIGLA